MDGEFSRRIPPQAGSSDADDADAGILTGIHRWKPEATYRSHPRLTDSLGQASMVLSPREVALWRMQFTSDYSRKDTISVYQEWTISDDSQKDTPKIFKETQIKVLVRGLAEQSPTPEVT